MSLPKLRGEEKKMNDKLLKAIQEWQDGIYKIVKRYCKTDTVIFTNEHDTSNRKMLLVNENIIKRMDYTDPKAYADIPLLFPEYNPYKNGGS